MANKASPTAHRYKVIIEEIFFSHWKEGVSSFEFDRDEIEKVAKKLGIQLPKNIGDVPYTFRYRALLPEKMLATQPPGLEWIIEGAGRSRYRFKLVTETRVTPSETLVTIAIPNATPELIRAYALDDEQALLAIIRYNRLVDTFLGLSAYSLQNHLRTTVKSIGQIEIDELYIGIDKRGAHYLIPVQAKAGKDQIGVVQTSQDIKFAAEKFPGLRCRPLAVQFMNKDVIAMFELALQEDEVRVVEERHYKLVPADQLNASTVRNYRD